MQPSLKQNDFNGYSPSLRNFLISCPNPEIWPQHNVRQRRELKVESLLPKWPPLGTWPCSWAQGILMTRAHDVFSVVTAVSSIARSDHSTDPARLPMVSELAPSVGRKERLLTAPSEPAGTTSTVQYRTERVGQRTLVFGLGSHHLIWLFTSAWRKWEPREV